MAKWIPTSKRLPDSSLVLVTIRVLLPRVSMAIMIGGSWFENGKYIPDEKVIAWMPLPEPYEEDEQ